MLLFAICAYDGNVAVPWAGMRKQAIHKKSTGGLLFSFPQSSTPYEGPSGDGRPLVFRFALKETCSDR